MQQYDLLVEKYWVTQSGYFRLETIVALGMGITYGNILFYHGIYKRRGDKKISIREYNERAVYDCFNNTFPADCGSPNLDIPPITIDDSTYLDKRAHYTPYLIPAAISFASENYVSNLTNPSDMPHVLVLNFDDPNPQHYINKDKPFHVKVKRGYCYRKCDGKTCYKKSDLIDPHVQMKTGNFINVMSFP